MLPLLTLPEAARLLRVSDRTLYGLARRRAVPVLRLGGRWLFDRAALEAWAAARIEGGEARPAPPPILAGSDDPLLAWALRESRSGLALLTVGSLEGITALAEGRAMVAALHVPDAEGGGWNLGLVESAMPRAGLVGFAWARRVQGLIVAPGNPLGLRTAADLARPGVRVALRDARSGSHVLLTHLLSEAGLRLDALEATVCGAADHAAAAGAVAAGLADAAFGIQAAAGGLGFVPLAVERFDLFLRRAHCFAAPVQALLALARTDAFVARAAALGGYDVRETGTVVLTQPG